MESFRFRLAALVMRHRGLTALIFVLITAFFAVGLRNVQLKTIFSDLLPKDDPFWDTHTPPWNGAAAAASAR